MCSCDFADPPSVFEENFRKARPTRKNTGDGYRCCECRRIIPWGAWYQECRGCWEGEWHTYRTCIRCTARREAHARFDECGAPFKRLRDCLVEALHESGRPHWGDYGTMFRSDLARIREKLAQLEIDRAARYRQAGLEKAARQRSLAWRGTGI